MRTNLVLMLTILAAVALRLTSAQEPLSPAHDAGEITAPGTQPPRAERAEPPLTNGDLVKLHKLGMGDEVLMRIGQSPSRPGRSDRSSGASHRRWN